MRPPLSRTWGEFGLHLVNFTVMLFLAPRLQMKMNIWSLNILWRIFDLSKKIFDFTLTYAVDETCLEKCLRISVGWIWIWY
jgi:hypothetical protein